MSNFSYVIDSSFQPFSMQEMLVPFTAYKDAFEKTEEQYNTLSDNADKFKYLSENLPEGSKARQLYEGYANDLRTQAEDLAHNGLTMGNRRALTSMKRRYQGEIGRIVQADEAMKEEKKLRQTLSAQDSSRLYAIDNLNIDDFLDGNNPNLYSVSGNELYTRGAAAGKAASSRVFSAGDAGSTLNGYYRDYVQKMGYSAETIRKFYQDMSAIPELQMAADAILEERGVNQNLTGVNLQRARQSVINGMIDGAVYSETHNPQRDLGVVDATTKYQTNVSLASNGMTYNEKTGKITYDKLNDPNYQKAVALAVAKNGGKQGNQKYTGYDKLTYNSRGGASVEYVDKIPSRATKVNVEKVASDDPQNPDKAEYQITVGTGADKLVLGSINAKTGEYTKHDFTPKDFSKYFRHGISWYQRPWDTYNPKYDAANIKGIAEDVYQTLHREGENGFKNYEYYLEPDNVGWNNNGGGFYRNPLARIDGTINNEDPAIYDNLDSNWDIKK